MSKTLSFYFPLDVPALDTLVAGFQKEFDELIKDTFSEQEIEQLENKLDALAAVYVSPVLSELQFEDFDAQECHQRLFLECMCVLHLENLPYLESNPFQVSWLQMFLNRFSEFLVESGTSSRLVDKEAFLSEISRFKNIENLIRHEKPYVPPPQHGVSAPVLPIDFLILDVFKEIDRLRSEGKLRDTLERIAELEKPRRLFTIMKEGKLDAHSLLKLSGLNPKDFDDNLEKLKFFLKKI